MTSNKVSVVGFVTYGDKILLGKKKPGSNQTLSGLWHIPGGGLKESETHKDGVRREILEEAGINIRVNEYLGSHVTPRGTSVMWYKCDALSPDIVAGSDLEKVCWATKEEVLERCDDLIKGMWPDSIREYINSL